MKYCGKILFLKKGYQCSLHCHKVKTETFYVLKGQIKIELMKDGILIDRIMNHGDTQFILPFTYHRFSGIKNSKIIEFSTHDKPTDSYRLEQSKKLC